MKKIYVIGDVHTVSAFRLAGVQGMVSNPNSAGAALDEVVRRGDAGVVAITNELASHVGDRIIEINLSQMTPVVIEIPGIDEAPVFRRSVVGYIAEALGIAL